MISFELLMKMNMGNSFLQKESFLFFSRAFLKIRKREIVKERRLKKFVIDDITGEYDDTGEEVSFFSHFPLSLSFKLNFWRVVV